MITASGPPDVIFARVTQRQETDLAFLRRMARAHNYDFTIRGKQLVFYSQPSLETDEPVATIARTDLMRFAFRVKTHHVYKAARVSYQLPETKELLTQKVTGASIVPTSDTLTLTVRCENGQQASLKATSALHNANESRTTACFTASGETFYSAGNNLTITGCGVNDGKYLIERARHRLERATGYTTEFDARRVD